MKQRITHTPLRQQEIHSEYNVLIDLCRVKIPPPANADWKRPDTCRISIHPFKDQLLAGSPTFARVTIWDPRTAADSLLTHTHMTVAAQKNMYQMDPVFDCEWNPQDEHVFMTAHAQMVRIWDARKLSQSVSILLVRRDGEEKVRWSLSASAFCCHLSYMSN